MDEWLSYPEETDRKILLKANKSIDPFQPNEFDKKVIRASEAFGIKFDGFLDHFPYFILRLPFQAIHLLFDDLTEEILSSETAQLRSIFNILEEAIETNQAYPPPSWVQQLISQNYNSHCFFIQENQPWGTEPSTAVSSTDKIIPSLLIGVYINLFDKKYKRHLLPRFENLSYYKHLSDSYAIFRIDNFEKILSLFSCKEDGSMKLFRFFFFMNFLVRYNSWLCAKEIDQSRNNNNLVNPNQAWKNFFKEELKELNYDIIFFLLFACQLTRNTLALMNMQELVSLNPSIAYKEKCFLDLVIAMIKQQSKVHFISICTEIFEDSASQNLFSQLFFSRDIRTVVPGGVFFNFRAILENVSDMKKIISYVCTAVYVKEREEFPFCSILQLKISDPKKKPFCKIFFISEFFKLFEQLKDIPTTILKNVSVKSSLIFSTSEFEIRKIGKKIIFALRNRNDTFENEDRLLNQIIESSKGISFYPETEELEIPQISVESEIKLDREFILEIHCDKMIIQFKFTRTRVKICFIVLSESDRISQVILGIIAGYKDINSASFALKLKENINYNYFKSVMRYFSNVAVYLSNVSRCNQATLKQISDVFLQGSIQLQIKSRVNFSYYPKFKSVHMTCTLNNAEKKNLWGNYSYYFEMVRRLLSQVTLNYLYIDLEILLQPRLVYSQLTSSQLINNIKEVFVCYSPIRIFNTNYSAFFQALKMNSIKLTLIQQYIDYPILTASSENEMLTSLEFRSLDLISLQESCDLSKFNNFLTSRNSIRNFRIYHYKRGFPVPLFLNQTKRYDRSNLIEHFYKDIFVHHYQTCFPLQNAIKTCNLLKLFPHIKFKNVIIHECLKKRSGEMLTDEIYFVLFCQKKTLQRLKKFVILLVAQFLKRKYQMKEYIPRIKRF